MTFHRLPPDSPPPSQPVGAGNQPVKGQTKPAASRSLPSKSTARPTSTTGNTKSADPKSGVKGSIIGRVLGAIRPLPTPPNQSAVTPESAPPLPARPSQEKETQLLAKELYLQHLTRDNASVDEVKIEKQADGSYKAWTTSVHGVVREEKTPPTQAQITEWAKTRKKQIGDAEAFLNIKANLREGVSRVEIKRNSDNNYEKLELEANGAVVRSPLPKTIEYYANRMNRLK